MSMDDPVDAPRMPNAMTDRLDVPLVTGILVVAEDERINLARSAVASFINQTYPNKEVIIVNAAPNKTVLEEQWPTLREFRVDPIMYPTIGALRNKGIDEAKGEWILPFDDDDHSHLHRMFMQMAVRRDHHCVMLDRQVRVDTERQTLCIYERKAGISNTVLFPRHAADNSLNLYDPDMIEAGEDDEFVERAFGARWVCLNTLPTQNGQEWFPGPCMTIAYYHTRNKSSRERFFGQYAGTQYDGLVCGTIPDDYLSYITDVMGKAGFSVNIGSPATGATTEGAPSGPVGAIN